MSAVAKLIRAVGLNSFQYATVLTAFGTYFVSLNPAEQERLLRSLHITSPALVMGIMFVAYVVLRLRRQATTSPNANLSWTLDSFLEKPSVFFAMLFAACCAGWDAMDPIKQQAALTYLHIDTLSPLWPLLTAVLAVMRASAVEAPPEPEPGLNASYLPESRNRDSGSQ